MSLWPPGQRRGPDLEGRLMGRGVDLHPTSPSALLHLPSRDRFPTDISAVSLGSFWGVMEAQRDPATADGWCLLQGTLQKGNG